MDKQHEGGSKSINKNTWANSGGRSREHQGMIGIQEANGRQRREKGESSKAWWDMLKIPNYILA